MSLSHLRWPGMVRAVEPRRTSARRRTSPTAGTAHLTADWWPEHRSRRGATTVDVQGLPDDVARLARREEHVRGSQLGGLAGAAEPRAVPELRQVLLRLAVRDLQRRPDRAGRHGVDADALGGELLGQALGEVVDRGLGRGVVEQLRRGVVGLDRRRVDDRGSRLQVLQGLPGHPEEREDVDVVDVLQLLVGQLLEPALDGDLPAG